MTESTAADLAIGAGAEGGARWSVDRRIPLALIVAGAVWLGGACGAVAVLYSTVSSQGDRITRLETADAANAKMMQDTKVDVARIFERVDSILALLRREAAKTP